PRIIGDELGMERWNTMRISSNWDANIPDILLANLRAMRKGIEWDGDTNMAWNMKTLLMLARAGALEIVARPMPEIVRDANETDDAFETRLLEMMQNHWSVCAVKILAGADLQSSNYWSTVVAKSRRESLAAATSNWDRMTEALDHKRPLEQILREVY